MADAGVTITKASSTDIPEIAAMIQELADFEKESAANKATHAKLSSTINLADDAAAAAAQDPRKVAHCFVLKDGAKTAGMALFFYNYSTWLASPGVYLEDLFVRPAFRRRGFATRLFGALAEEVERISDEGNGRLEWSCLRWNEGALQFYDKLGGVRQEEWIGIRVQGREKLARLRQLAKDEAAS